MRYWRTIGLAVGLVLVLTTGAYAAPPTVNLRAYTPSPQPGVYALCAADITASRDVQRLLVSVACQERDLDGTGWHNVGGSPPASDCNDCSYEAVADSPLCSQFQHRGLFQIRTKADGFYVTYNGIRHDKAAEYSNTDIMKCPR